MTLVQHKAIKWISGLLLFETVLYHCTHSRKGWRWDRSCLGFGYGLEVTQTIKSKAEKRIKGWIGKFTLRMFSETSRYTLSSPSKFFILLMSSTVWCSLKFYCMKVFFFFFFLTVLSVEEQLLWEAGVKLQSISCLFLKEKWVYDSSAWFLRKIRKNCK